jgi:ubiquinone/menaquinone biosynthesis C-methylase UbiE
LQIGSERAERQGLHLSWQQADAEHLGFADAGFGIVLSCVGVMFAPFHQPVRRSRTSWCASPVRAGASS